MNLITGGSGLLGRHLIKKLLDAGETVRVYDVKRPDTMPSGVEFIEGDITEKDKVKDACQGCKVVFHLAARMPQYMLKEKDFHAINVGGTVNVIEGCIKHRVKRLVFASTIEIYGAQRSLPVKEDAHLNFTGVYSRNKWECEGLLLKAMNENGLDVVMLRMPMVLGPFFYHEKSMIELFKRINKGRLIPLPTREDIPYSCVSASDTADAFILAAKKPKAAGEAFNIAAADAPPIRQFLESLIKAVGSGSRIVVIPSWISYPMLKSLRYFFETIPVVKTPTEFIEYAFVGGSYDISKARRLLGFSPKKSCLKAILETYNWYLKAKK